VKSKLGSRWWWEKVSMDFCFVYFCGVVVLVMDGYEVGRV